MLSRSFAALRHQILRPNPWLKSLKQRQTQIRRAATQAQTQSRIQRLESKLPAFLRRYTTPLRTAPVSHISAFLILHEITAVVPLFGFVAVFHYFDWLPPFIAEGAIAKAGVERFGKYLRKKGWIHDEDAAGAIDVAAGEVGVGEDAKKGRLRGGAGKWFRRGERDVGEDGETKGRLGDGASRWWGRGEGGVRLAVEFATAYALVKLLVPFRVVFSVWATPAFARWTVVPVIGWAGRLSARAWTVLGRSGVNKGVVGKRMASPAAGTNAVGGGVLPKVK